MAYRLDGKAQTATFGPYPLLTLAEARQKRDELRRKLLDGTDPRPKVERKVPTFTRRRRPSGGAERHHARLPDERRPRARHAHRAGHRIHAHDAIARDDLLRPLNRMDAAGLHVYVRRARLWASQVFDYAVEQGYRTDNPAQAIRTEKAFGRAKVENHAALDPWRCRHSCSGSGWSRRTCSPSWPAGCWRSPGCAPSSCATWSGARWKVMFGASRKGR